MLTLAITTNANRPDLSKVIHIHGNCYYTRTNNTWRPISSDVNGLDLVDTIRRSELQRRDAGVPREARFCHLCFPEHHAALRRN